MKKFLLTAVFAVLGAWVFAQERIAVFPLEDMNNVFTGNEAFRFYQRFTNEVATVMADRHIVPRQQIERLIGPEMDFQLTIFSAQEKTAEMMRVQNATQILSGYIARDGSNIEVTVSLYTYPELRQLPGGRTVTVANVNELFNKIPELVQQMQNTITEGTAQPIPEGLLYEIVDRKTVTITKYIGNAATVNIPSHILDFPVMTIGGGAFYGCRSLTSVTIPSSVMSIGLWAFRGCESLISVTIPSSVTYLGIDAFSGCIRLSSITVDNRNPVYASVDGVLFDKNIRTLITYPEGKNQRTYIIPSSVTTIRNNAFFACTSLTSVTIPSSVTSIGEDAFAYCSRLTSITIPSSVMSIEAWAFVGCDSLTSITIPSSVMSIEYGAFANLDNLTSVTISRRTQVGLDAIPPNARITYRD